MFLFSEQILALLFPNARSGTILLQISSFTIIFTVLSQTVNGALQGLGKVLVPPIALGIGACVKLILNLVLIPIPEIGASGAAIGSVVCHTISFIIGISITKPMIAPKGSARPDKSYSLNALDLEPVA